MDQPSHVYRVPARIFHWGMALLLIPMIIAGGVMVQEGISRPLQNTLFIFHKNVGTLLLLLIALRILYRWRNPPPPEPDELPAWQKMASHWTHLLLYALMVIMPVAGYIRVRAGGFPIEMLDAMGAPTLIPKSEALAAFAKSVHYFGSWAIMILIAMHIAAALQHKLIKKDNVFSRMWP